MGDEGAQIASAWGEQVGSFERILKSLVLDLNRLNSRVDRVEGHHGTQIDSMKRELDTFVANVQGFTSQQEALENERRNRDWTRQFLPHFSRSGGQEPRLESGKNNSQNQPVGKIDHPQSFDDAHTNAGVLDSCEETRKADLKRSRAQQRWRWALMKIRMQQIRGRIPMTTTYIGPSNSLSIRLGEVEASLNSMDYNLRHLTAHAGPDKVNEALRTANWLTEALVGGIGQDIANAEGVFSRLLTLEHKVNAVCELAAAANSRSQIVELSCENFRHGLREVAEQAASAFEDVSILRNKMDKEEALSKDELPRARRQAAAFVSALRNTCFAAMRSRHVASLPGGKILIQNCLLPMHRQLELYKNPQILLNGAGDFDQWRTMALQAARFLFWMLQEDKPTQEQKTGTSGIMENTPRKTSTLADVPIDLVGEQAYRIEKDYDAEFIVDVVGSILNARELAGARVEEK